MNAILRQYASDDSRLQHEDDLRVKSKIRQGLNHLQRTSDKDERIYARLGTDRMGSKKKFQPRQADNLQSLGAAMKWRGNCAGLG